MKYIVFDRNAKDIIKLLYSVDDSFTCENTLCMYSVLELKFEAVESDTELIFLDISMPEISPYIFDKFISSIDYGCKIVCMGMDVESGIADFIKRKAYRQVIEAKHPENRGDILEIFSKLETSKNSVDTDVHINNNIEIHTFGCFDIFVAGSPVIFKNRKSKELLALLVDMAGSVVTSEYAITRLWPGKIYDDNLAALFRMTLKSLRDTLKKNGIQHILNENRNARYIKNTGIYYDYFEFLSGNKEVISGFNGEYMCEYSWAEITLAKLSRIAGIF